MMDFAFSNLVCPHVRVSRATGLSFQLETGTESSAFDCMNRCENNTLCESITYISVTNECWLHNGTERSDDACHNDLLGYFYIKVCTCKYSRSSSARIFFIAPEFFRYKSVYIRYDQDFPNIFILKSKNVTQYYFLII